MRPFWRWLVCALLQCALPGRAVLRRVAPWCAALCRVASRRAVACCALGRLVMLRCTVVRCGAVCPAASCCAVVGRWRLGWPVSWCGVRVRAWLVGGFLHCASPRYPWGARGKLVGGWGVRSGGWLAGSVVWGSGFAARAGGSGRWPWGCPPWGPVPWSRVLWGSRSLALGAVAVPSSSSGACEVPLVVAGVVAWQ